MDIYFDEDLTLFESQGDIRSLVMDGFRPTKSKREYYAKRWSDAGWASQKRRAEERRKALEGSACVNCGSTEDIEWDHRNPKEKVTDISSAIYKMGDRNYADELAKCQPLCGPCHRRKRSVWLVNDKRVVLADAGRHRANFDVTAATWIGFFIPEQDDE